MRALCKNMHSSKNAPGWRERLHMTRPWSLLSLKKRPFLAALEDGPYPEDRVREMSSLPQFVDAAG
jgi:hypothetical protein